MDFPKQIRTIGAFAFEGCVRLTRISIAKDCTYAQIGQYAFKDCEALKYVMFPKCVSSIAQGTFLGCHGLVDTSIQNITDTEFFSK